MCHACLHVVLLFVLSSVQYISFNGQLFTLPAYTPQFFVFLIIVAMSKPLYALDSIIVETRSLVTLH